MVFIHDSLFTILLFTIVMAVSGLSYHMVHAAVIGPVHEVVSFPQCFPPGIIKSLSEHLKGVVADGYFLNVLEMSSSCSLPDNCDQS